MSRLLSLKWFKGKGLLPTLMTEFGGDVEQAIRFSLSGESPKKKTSPELRTRQGESAKQFYTARDIGRELGVEASLVRTVMRNKGLAPNDNLSGQGKRMAFSQRFSYETYLVIKRIVKEELDRKRSHGN